MSVAVGIAGAGSVALGTAALLGENGHAPMLWSPSGARSAALKDGLTATGAVSGTSHPAVAHSARHLAEESDCLLVALPGYGHKVVFDALAPHIREGQPVIVSSHASFGALYLAGLLNKRGVRAPIVAWGTTVVTGRATGPAEVMVNTVRARVDACTLPDDGDKDRGRDGGGDGTGLELCRRLFGDRFEPRDGLLAITLSNLNPQNHMGIALANMTRMERGEHWSQGENVTPHVGALLEALDRERLAIAEALGLSVRTIFEHFHLSFHVPEASVSEMNRQMHAEGRGGTGPSTADSRYVTEDVPYGLCVTELLGHLTGRPATLHSAGIDIFSAMYGRDFRSENSILPALQLSRHGLSALRNAAKTGILA